MSLKPFLLTVRAQIHCRPDAERSVHLSQIARIIGDHKLEEFVADRAPLFYRSPDRIVERLNEGHFLTAFRETLRRLPTAANFRDSHFAEILSAIVAQEILGWKLIYSKLRLLTAENANAYKMDLVLFDPSQSEPAFILGEVKSSMKSEIPSNHHKSCYPNLFDSLRTYSSEDLAFDLTAARDNVNALPRAERCIVKKALMPYATRKILYAGFSVIDTETRLDEETEMLATRKSNKTFDIDLICVDEIASVSESTYSILKAMRDV